tara:strand:- start:77 stop:436 length:360 start_codon:yes stop_codon:yes gene_type:complete
MKNFETFVNEDYDSAFNIKILKNIKFILPSWEAVDDMFNNGDEFEIGFSNKADMDKINTDINKLKRKEKSVKAMDIAWRKNEFERDFVVISGGNYSGLTHLFAALDKHYGKFGDSMGWN